MNIFLLDKCLKYFFSSCLNYKKCCWGRGGRSGEVAPAYEVIKKLLKKIICGSTRCIPLHAAAATKCVKKKKKKKKKNQGVSWLLKV